MTAVNTIQILQGRVLTQTSMLGGLTIYHPNFL